VNCPLNGANHYSRDGFMSVNGNGGSKPNYEPNSFGGPVEEKSYALKLTPTMGDIGRHPF